MEIHFEQFGYFQTGTFKVFLHNQYDLPSAQHNQAHINFFSFGYGRRLVIRNVDSYKESTSAKPCNQLWIKECQEVERMQQIESEYRYNL